MPKKILLKSRLYKQSVSLKVKFMNKHIRDCHVKECAGKTTFYSYNLAIALIKEARTGRDTIRVPDPKNKEKHFLIRRYSVPIGFKRKDRGKHRPSVCIPLYDLKVVIKKGKYLCTAYPTSVY